MTVCGRPLSYKYWASRRSGQTAGRRLRQIPDLQQPTVACAHPVLDPDEAMLLGEVQREGVALIETPRAYQLAS